MKSNIKKKCLSFICSASLVTGLTVSPAGSVFGYTAGFTVSAEGEEEGETIKTEAMGIFLTLLLGSGFRMVGSFADQAQALGKQFDQWVADTQATITAGTIVAGTMFKNGWMKLSSDVANAYNSFAGWLTETLSIPKTGTVEVPLAEGTANVYSATGLATPLNIAQRDYGNGDIRYWTIAGEEGVYLRFYYSTTYPCPYRVMAMSKEPNKQFSYNGSVSTIGSSNVGVNGVLYYYGSIGGSYTNTLSYWTIYDLQCVFGDTSLPSVRDIAYAMANSLEGGLDDQVLTGESLDLKDGIGLDQDQALLYDISALAEYAGVLDQTLTDAQDLVGVLTDAIARSKAEADEEEDEDAEVIPWDLVDSDKDSKVAPDDITDVPPNDTGMYKTLGLEKIFPFSIPFDIYYFIKMFNAPAQPLEFDIPFVVTGVINQNYHVDLSIFNPVAQIFRLMMLVGFIWFLITKTRDFLRS